MASTCHCTRGHRGCGSCDRCRYLGKGPNGWAPGELAAAIICAVIFIVSLAAFIGGLYMLATIR